MPDVRNVFICSASIKINIDCGRTTLHPNLLPSETFDDWSSYLHTS